MADSRSGAGGKIVANRRKQRLATTPYDRQRSQPPADKSPGWFSGRVLPSARAIASGAGKVLASVLYSESSSSEEYEDEDSGDDDLDNDEDAYDEVNALHERIETKRKIEQLIMQETFSREECDRLTELLKSRVIDWSMEAEKRFAAAPGKMTDNEVGDTYNEAVLEAKKWFQEKKMGPSSVANADEGMCDLNASETEHVNGAVGSPLDLARSYMRDRPPWASPTKRIELSTPLTARIELIKEGTSYSVGHDYLSSSKKRNSVASGSWNIHEELRRVRAKATEDMLRSSSSRIDPSLFAIATSRQEGMGKKAIEPDPFRKNHQIGVLMDAGVSSDPALAVSHEPPEIEVTKIGRTPGRKPIIDGFSLSQTSLSAGGITSENHEQDNEDRRDTSKDRFLKAGNLEGRCELLTEACVEIPIVTETASIASDSHNSLSMQPEELSEEMIQPSTNEKTDLMHGKQVAKMSDGSLRRSKRRGK
ncbi:protein KAKU4-like isoform X3 [Primulina tabacum]|uniref:protein KAKU4-like isoform X3 n=1 Tax=Primulina tabacum TaxID=48773 RepID=UPI003F59D7F4